MSPSGQSLLISDNAVHLCSSIMDVYFECLSLFCVRFQLPLAPVQSRDVFAVADFFATSNGAPRGSHTALLRSHREGQVPEVTQNPTRYLRRRLN